MKLDVKRNILKKSVDEMVKKTPAAMTIIDIRKTGGPNKPTETVMTPGKSYIDEPQESSVRNQSNYNKKIKHPEPVSTRKVYGFKTGKN